MLSIPFGLVAAVTLREVLAQLRPQLSATVQFGQFGENFANLIHVQN